MSMHVGWVGQRTYTRSDTRFA